MRIELECEHPLVRLSEVMRKKEYSLNTKEAIFGCLRKFPPKSEERTEKMVEFTEIIQDSETEEEALQRIESLVSKTATTIL